MCSSDLVKLLRVLQQHTFEPLGESRPKKVDIRVICATNANLNEMVAQRTFREDLFYRINLITLHLPALRERRDDIPLLVRRFMEDSAASLSIDVPEITPEAMEFLTRLPYPGNIRQLKNMVERAVLIGGQRLGKDIFASVDGSTTAVEEIRPSGTLNDMERIAIEEALDKADGNLTQAARILGITRQTLYRRMDKYNMK